ncbi:MAG: M1 family aminopeptidase [Arcticibacter sp.]
MHLKSFLIPLSFVLFASAAKAQQSESFFADDKNSNGYNYTEAFSGSVYTRAGNQYRSASGKPGHAYWQNRADYDIDVVLDEKQKTVTGSEVITYTNNSPDDLEFVWLQLDQNLFKQGSRGLSVVPISGSRGGINDKQFDGGFKIKTAKLVDKNGKETELNCMIDDTRMQLMLPEPLKAGGSSLRLKIEFSFIIPERGRDRMGILETSNGPVFSVAQWYPRMSVYDDISGWNTSPYLGPSEFYLDYGTFHVNITAPANHAVVCSGKLLNPQDVYSESQQKAWVQAERSDKVVVIRSERDARSASRPVAGTKTWKFRMENTRDVAWASSAAFMIDAARINLPEGRSSLAISAYPAESASKLAWGRSTEYVKASIEYYSAKWTEYPYPAAINVASNAGGMEYPGIVFCGSTARGSSLWSVTDHEFGHTWFPMIVGSNEGLHPWMDEGLNSFINELSTAAFNKGEYDKGGRNMRKWTSLIMDPALEPVTNSADNMKERNVAYLAYYKPAIALSVLRENVLGPERFDRAFKAYIDRWAYKHPTPDDFFRTMENVSGEDLNWFWRGWFFNNWKLDQAVSGVSYVKNDPSNGVLITISNLQKMVMPVVVEIKLKSGNTERVQLPVEIWKSDKSWTFHHPTTEDVVSVTIDPDQTLPDMNTDNNIWKVKS